MEAQVNNRVGGVTAPEGITPDPQITASAGPETITPDHVAGTPVAQAAPMPAEAQPGLGARAWSAINTPLMPKGGMRYLGPGGYIADEVRQYMEKKTSEEIASGNPLRAAFAQFASGTIADSQELARSMSSPANLALLLTGAPEAKAALEALPVLARSIGAARTLMLGYYAFKGSEEALRGQLPGESWADMLQRRMFGAAAVYAIGIHAGSRGVGMAQSMLAKHFGLTDDMAARVADRVTKINDLRKLSEDYDARDELAKEAAKNNVAGMEGRLKKLPEDIRAQGAILQRDFANAVQAEHARLGKMFESVEEKAGNATVADPLAVAENLRGNLLHFGIDESTAGMLARKLTAKFIPREFAEMPLETAQKLMAGSEMDWRDVKMLRGDLSREALRPAITPQVRAGIHGTVDYLLEKQQDIANKVGMTDLHNQARTEYSDLMRRTSASPIGRRLLAHVTDDDVVDNQRLSSFMGSKREIEITKRIFGAFGVDTKPIDKLYEERENVKTAIKEEKPALVPKEDRRLVERALVEAKAPEPGKAAVVPGVDYDQLANKTAAELGAMRVQKLMENARSSAMIRPMPWVMFLYGAGRVIAGSPFGAFMATYGGTRIAMNELYTNPRYAPWIASECGITDLARTKTALRRLGVMGASVSATRARAMDTGRRGPVEE